MAKTFEHHWKVFKMAWPDLTFVKVERSVAEVFWIARDSEIAEKDEQIAALTAERDGLLKADEQRARDITRLTIERDDLRGKLAEEIDRKLFLQERIDAASVAQDQLEGKLRRLKATVDKLTEISRLPDECGQYILGLKFSIVMILAALEGKE